METKKTQAEPLPLFTWTEMSGTIIPEPLTVKREPVDAVVNEIQRRIAPRYLLDTLAYETGGDGETLLVIEYSAAGANGRRMECSGCATYQHWQDRKTGMKGLIAYYDGDKTPREYSEGTLDDWFGDEPGENASPEHIYYHLMKSKGILADTINSACCAPGPYDDDPDFIPDDWSVVEESQTPEPLNQRIRHIYGKLEGHSLFTRTDLDDIRGKKDVCEVYDSLGAFACGESDIEFPDTKENIDCFLDILPEVSEEHFCRNIDGDVSFREVLIDVLKRKTALLDAQQDDI